MGCVPLPPPGCWSLDSLILMIYIFCLVIFLFFNCSRFLGFSKTAVIFVFSFSCRGGDQGGGRGAV